MLEAKVQNWWTNVWHRPPTDSVTKVSNDAENCFETIKQKMLYGSDYEIANSLATSLYKEKGFSLSQAIYLKLYKTWQICSRTNQFRCYLWAYVKQSWDDGLFLVPSQEYLPRLFLISSLGFFFKNATTRDHSDATSFLPLNTRNL